MAWLDGENYWLTKRGRRDYLKHVNPTIPDGVKEPTDLMILQHCHLGCWNTPWKPVWRPEWNHMLGVIKGYRLCHFERRKIQ